MVKFGFVMHSFSNSRVLERVGKMLQVSYLMLKLVYNVFYLILLKSEV